MPGSWAGAAAVFCLLSPLTAQTPSPGPATYVGVETCKGCHEEVVSQLSTNPHHVLEVNEKKGWKGKTCEACHGPGSRHADSADPKDIRNPAKLSPAETDRLCLSCHLNQRTQAGRIQSGHAKNQVACVSCHSMHKTPEELKPTKAATINQECASCHVSVWVQFQRPYKHKLPENAMSCVDCHNPHGRNMTSTVRMTASADEPSCLNCHGDKRGPFVFEHEPMRTDGCTACHEPHGSSHPRMLTRHDERVTCLECHANIGVPKPGQNGALGGVPPAFHNLNVPRFGQCVTCHVKVHGSNVDRTFLR
jgi:DmsE family decaheme c-type cytochrome